MLKFKLAAGLAAAALMTSAAVAQTNTSQSGGQSAASGQLMTQMSPNMMRGSKLMGVDVYGSDNQKIGDIDEVLVDREGKIQAIVVGIGGFLGIGEKNVAIPYGQIQWMTDEQARTAANTQAGGTNTAGGVTTPANPSGTTASNTTQPATTGSTGAGGTTAGGTTSSANNDGVPARAMVRMSKADLQNAPEFRYSSDTARSNTGGGAGGTNPPATTNRPAAPAQ